MWRGCGDAGAAIILLFLDGEAAGIVRTHNFGVCGAVIICARGGEANTRASLFNSFGSRPAGHAQRASAWGGCGPPARRAESFGGGERDEIPPRRGSPFPDRPLAAGIITVKCNLEGGDHAETRRAGSVGAAPLWKPAARKLFELQLLPIKILATGLFPPSQCGYPQQKDSGPCS